MLPRRLESEFAPPAYLVKTYRGEGAYQGKARCEWEEQRQRVVRERQGCQAYTDDRIDETDEDEVRGHRQKVVETLGQRILEVRRPDLAHGRMGRRLVRACDYVKVRHYRSPQPRRSRFTRGHR